MQNSIEMIGFCFFSIPPRMDKHTPYVDIYTHRASKIFINFSKKNLQRSLFFVILQITL